MDKSQAIRHEKYVENGEDFDFTTYNDITVIIHVKSGYYNAGKLCSDIGYEFKSLNRNQGFQRKIQMLNGTNSTVGYVYLIKYDTYIIIGRTFDVK